MRCPPPNDLLLKMLMLTGLTLEISVEECKNQRFGGMYITSIRMKSISELGTMLAVTSKLADYFHPGDGGDVLLQDIGSYKSHMASHPKRRHSS
jgi:hypothetical protein